MNGPRSKAYAGVSFRAVGEHPTDAPAAPPTASGTPAAAVSLFTNDGRAHTLTADLDKDTYQYVAADGRTVGPRAGLSAGGVVAWMADVGLDTADPQVAAEAAEVAATLLSPGPNGGWRGTGSSSSSGSIYRQFAHGSDAYAGAQRSARWPWTDAAVAAGGAVLWALGVWWIVRRFGPGRPRTAAA